VGGAASSAQVVASSSSSVGGGGGPGGSGGAPATGCTGQYGHVPFFILCSETQMVCSFYAHVEPQSCADLCASGGGECLLVYNNLNDMAGCMTENTVSCDELTLLDAICVCSFGCGSGPPCQASQTCMGGTCI
jgi:hypothetical protein